MKLWSLFAQNDRKTDDEKAIARYLLWEFRHSVECMAEDLACSQALKNAYPAPGTPWLQRESALYGALDPHPAWPRRSRTIYRKHAKYRKWLLTRFRQQPVPSSCRTLAFYREKYLKLGIERSTGGDDYVGLQTEKLEAMRTAGDERKQLHEPYREAMLAESKSAPKWLPKRWKF